MKKDKKGHKKLIFSSSFKDLVIIAIILIIILILSYYFDVFVFIVELYQKYPHAITYIDEIFVGLLALSISLAVFAWRRWFELKKETTERIRLQEELIGVANTKAETERIISKQLHSEIELRKQEEISHILKAKKKNKG